MEFVPRRVCLNCGALFYAPPVQIRRGGGKYCSKKCHGEYVKAQFNMHRVIKEATPRKVRKEKILKRSVPGWRPHNYRGGKVERTCTTCEKSFMARAVDVSRGQARFCSRRCFSIGAAKDTAMRGAYSRARGGRREDLGGQYFRSGWEANYARYLNWLKARGEILEWVFEPQTFVFHGVTRGALSYTPDFKITEKDGSVVFHEIKGWMDGKSKTKLRRMSKYYPEVRVIVIGEAEYKAIKKFSAPIPGWE